MIVAHVASKALCKILVYTNQSTPVIASRALEMGATGYVLKKGSHDELLWALQEVREGKPFISHNLTSEIAIVEIRGTRNPLKRLTVRELQALAFIAEGKPYRAIAAHLHVSYKTVANTCAGTQDEIRREHTVRTHARSSRTTVKDTQRPASALLS